MSKLLRFRGVLSLPCICIWFFSNFLGAQAVSIYLEEVPASVGSPVSINVRVDNFTGVAGAQFSVNWNPDELEYVGVSNLALSATESDNFNRNETELGNLGYIVADMTLQGFDLEDETVLFSIDFNVIAPDNTLAEVFFSGDPVSQVVADATSATLEAEYLNGAVVIGNPSSTNEVAQDHPAFTASPNPFSATCLLTYLADHSGKAQLQAFDAAGKEIFSQAIELVAGENRIPLSAGDLPAAGIYFLRLSTDSGSFGRKVFLKGR